jgi:ketosteroid isomerase-like protein
MSVADVEEANRHFYRAFETLDLSQMDAVWAHDERVACVHPGWSLLRGWESVRASWEAIFENTGEIRFSLGDVCVTEVGDLAWLTCTENILSEVGGQLTATAVLATNLFERRGGRWLMIHHHASHVFAARAAEPTDAA